MEQNINREARRFLGRLVSSRDGTSPLTALPHLFHFFLALTRSHIAKKLLLSQKACCKNQRFSSKNLL